MEGAKHIKDITGEWPVYPGHPLTVAWEIMAIFPGPADALALVTENGLNCPAAVADIRISGAGGEVNSACHLLRMARSGKFVTCIKFGGREFSGIVCMTPEFKPGDQAPDGYLAWHEWAEVQHKAGLRQKECGRCGKWKYPQELSDQIDRHEAKSRKGPVTVETPVCLKCTTPS